MNFLDVTVINSLCGLQWDLLNFSLPEQKLTKTAPFFACLGWVHAIITNDNPAGLLLEPTQCYYLKEFFT